MRNAPYDVFPAPPDELVQGDPTGVPLVVIVGPTGVGKSDLALELAKANRGAIISADSRQIYAGFDIGTATPSAEELAAVPHDMITCVDPTYTYTVAEYQAAAREAIAKRRAQGYLPFLVGGTGLYVRAVLDGLTIPPAPPDPAFRASLEGVPDLHARLAEVDPDSAARLHPNDRVRLVRALEVHHATGRPIGEFQHTTPCPYKLLTLGVGAPRAYLYERIDARVLAMMANGFEDEVTALAARYGWDLPLLGTLGYAEIGAALRGELPRDEAIAVMAQHTRNYAKRQLTWFRGDRRVHWLMRDATRGTADLVQEADALLRRWALAGT
ncbi:MAG TPA: tRNA (adenosine(37)-N6)-dimethylallyltransferase MiaA [Oscillatoriaceae cyanobacterium]